MTSFILQAHLELIPFKGLATVCTAVFTQTNPYHTHIARHTPACVQGVETQPCKLSHLHVHFLPNTHTGSKKLLLWFYRLNDVSLTFILSHTHTGTGLARPDRPPRPSTRGQNPTPGRKDSARTDGRDDHI